MLHARAFGHELRNFHEKEGLDVDLHSDEEDFELSRDPSSYLPDSCPGRSRTRVFDDWSDEDE